MAKLGQSLRQSQNLMMTPQLQQAIKLLTLTHLELQTMIATEMEVNPMLEELDPSDAGDNSEVAEGDSLEDSIKEAVTEDFQEQQLLKEKDDFDWESYAESFDTNSSTPASMTGGDSDELPNYENIVSQTQSLAEHLEWQLKMENLSAEEWEIATNIIHNINDDGYLSVSLEDLAVEKKYKIADLEYMHDRIQRLDPVGCGSRNLEECLLAQARILEERSPVLEKVIRNHLADLQTKSYNKIAEALHLTVERVKSLELIIQGFHPKPGRLVGSGEVHYVVPDIYVVEVGGEFVVSLNDEGVPRLQVSKLYQAMLKKGGDEKAKEFVQEKLRSALWLIKSIQNRQRTIVKVAKAIVAKQQEFFKKGPRFMKPMILKDIAAEIEMHESTVSRVTTNKYMHTPIGVYELKTFFNAGIGGKEGGEDVSSDVLKMTIRDLIAKEDPKKPLSDQKIVELLEQKKLVVARRTIAKYRDELGILTSAQRKKT